MLAQRVADIARIPRLRDAPQLVSAKDADEQTPLDDGASLVVAAAVASGQSLLAVSQVLRELQTNKAITYLAAITRMASVADVDKLDRDLRMGEHAADYAFSVAERIHLPLVGRMASCAWDEELALLQEWSNIATGDVQTRLEASYWYFAKSPGAFRERAV